MSLVYNEFEGSDKNGNDEELKIEKMESNSRNKKKKSKRKKTTKKTDEEKKDTTNISKEKTIDKYIEICG